MTNQRGCDRGNPGNPGTGAMHAIEMCGMPELADNFSCNIHGCRGTARAIMVVFIDRNTFRETLRRTSVPSGVREGKGGFRCPVRDGGDDASTQGEAWPGYLMPAKTPIENLYNFGHGCIGRARSESRRAPYRREKWSDRKLPEDDSLKTRW